MNIQHVPVEWVNRVWPTVAPFIADAFSKSNGDYTVEYAQAMVLNGNWLLLVATDGTDIHGAATVVMYNRPKDRVAFITAIGGRLITSADTFLQLKALLAGFGATVLEGAAREAVARLWKRYGFEEKSRIVGVKL